MYCQQNRRSTQVTENSQLDEYEVLTPRHSPNYSIMATKTKLNRERQNSSFFYKSDSSILVSVDNSDLKVFDQNGEEFELEIIERPAKEQSDSLQKKKSQLKKITAFGNSRINKTTQPKVYLNMVRQLQQRLLDNMHEDKDTQLVVHWQQTILHRRHLQISGRNKHMS